MAQIWIFAGGGNLPVAAQPQLDSISTGMKSRLDRAKSVRQISAMPAMRSYYAVRQNHRHLRSPRVIGICGQLGRTSAAWLLTGLKEAFAACEAISSRGSKQSFEVHSGSTALV